MPKFVLRALAPLSTGRLSGDPRAGGDAATRHWWQSDDIRNLLMTLGGE